MRFIVSEKLRLARHLKESGYLNHHVCLIMLSKKSECTVRLVKHTHFIGFYVRYTGSKKFIVISLSSSRHICFKFDRFLLKN
jgi:hypothetical protein